MLKTFSYKFPSSVELEFNTMHKLNAFCTLFNSDTERVTKCSPSYSLVDLFTIKRICRCFYELNLIQITSML